MDSTLTTGKHDNELVIKLAQPQNFTQFLESCAEILQLQFSVMQYYKLACAVTKDNHGLCGFSYNTDHSVTFFAVPGTKDVGEALTEWFSQGNWSDYMKFATSNIELNDINI